MKKRMVSVLFATQFLFFSSVVNADVVEEGERYLGVPYQYGGDDPEEGFDPSGFTQYVTRQVYGLDLPRTVSEQWQQGENVNRADLEQGDLIFFGLNNKPTHVAFYTGGDELLHVTQSRGVERTSLSGSSYWNSRYLGAKRLDTEVEFPANRFVEEAANQLGVPYVFGESNPALGFDCSGLMQYVFQQQGVYLPRSAEEQWRVGNEVTESDLSPGDVVFFENTYKEGISHNGIYAGNGQFIHASRSEDVTVSYLSSAYWQEHYVGARNFDGLSLPEEEPVVSEATKYVGEVPYVRGGTSPEEGFDTAGFIQYVYNEVYDLELPRYAQGQLEFGKEIEKSDLVAGDLVFFEGNDLNPAIYIGGNRVVHVTLSTGVTITNYEASNYWRDRYVAAVRVLEDE